MERIRRPKPIIKVHQMTKHNNDRVCLALQTHDGNWEEILWNEHKRMKPYRKHISRFHTQALSPNDSITLHLFFLHCVVFFEAVTSYCFAGFVQLCFSFDECITVFLPNLTIIQFFSRIKAMIERFFSTLSSEKTENRLINHSLLISILMID